MCLISYTSHHQIMRLKLNQSIKPRHNPSTKYLWQHLTKSLKAMSCRMPDITSDLTKHNHKCNQGLTKYIRVNSLQVLIWINPLQLSKSWNNYTVKVTVSRDVSPCKLTDTYSPFRDITCLHFQVNLQGLHILRPPHNATYQRTGASSTISGDLKKYIPLHNINL